jgi:hypothetical protein
LEARAELRAWIEDWLTGRGPVNVWLGATVVNQAEADRDIPKLLATPARVRFLSIEPMLGPVDLLPFIRSDCWHGSRPGPGGRGGVMCSDCNGLGHQCLRLHWVIAGGESGPHARPAHPDWFRSLRDQCAASGVPYMHKQNGAWAPARDHGGTHLMKPDGTLVVREQTIMKMPGGRSADLVDRGHAGWVRMQRMDKHAAGRLLDGVTHDGFPQSDEGRT